MSLTHPETGHTETEASHRFWFDWLLITASVAVMIGQILVVCASTGETPMLSANDRSRWCTVRALVENGTYQIDSLVRERHPETKRRFWSSIDRVRHRGPDGKEHDYSSKPTLLPTLLAGEYWVIRQVSGLTLADHPFPVVRLMLVVTNVLPLIFYFWVLARMVDRLGVTRAARPYVMVAATFGTFLTTFSVTLNNHSVAAISVLLATVLALRIWQDDDRGWWRYFGVGLFGAFAVANELPALSFLAMLTAALAWRSPRQTLLAFGPAVVLVAIGFFGTNHLAHGTWSPAYAHRSDGPLVTDVSLDTATAFDDQRLSPEVEQRLGEAGIKLSDQAIIQVYQAGERWGIWDRVGQKRFAIVRGTTGIAVHRWGNWYDYDGSYWRNKQAGVDRGESSRWVYALHVLVGHHGIFSLSPIWLLSAAGAIMMIRGDRPGWRMFGVMVVVLWLVCLAFYISRPLGDRNYGGVSCGFRWMFWFTPLWLLSMVPAADWLLARRAGRVFGLVVLVISCISVASRFVNPWSHPWLFDLGTAIGWWQY